MLGKHGHVTLRLDGAKARCGGPALCAVCAQELAQARGEEQGYTIENDVPAPAGPKSKYPFTRMSVGDSFAVPPEDMRKVSNSAWMYGKRHDQKFATRNTPTGGRCWRIK